MIGIMIGGAIFSFILGIFIPPVWVLTILCLAGAVSEYSQQNNDRNIKDRYLTELKAILYDIFRFFRTRDTIGESARSKIESCTIEYLQRNEKSGDTRNVVFDIIFQVAHDAILLDERFSSDIEELKTVCLTCLDSMCDNGYISKQRREECEASVLKRVSLKSKV